LPITDVTLLVGPVLVTADPETDQTGRLAIFYRRRQHLHGRWTRTANWVDRNTLAELDPQPTHWRQNPADASLDPHQMFARAS
jgi:hypothetical protein